MPGFTPRAIADLKQLEYFVAVVDLACIGLRPNVTLEVDAIGAIAVSALFTVCVLEDNLQALRPLAMPATRSASGSSGIGAPFEIESPR